MTKKLSLYSRKRMVKGHEFNGAEWLNAINRCRPYTSEPPIGGIEGTESAATKAMLIVRQAFQSLKSGEVAPDDEETFDKLSHALGVACVRAGQIGGPEIDGNPMLEILVPGNAALRRCLDRRRKRGVWGLDGPAITELTEAIEVYEAIVQASSPEQMTAAHDLRTRALKGATLEAL